MGIRQLDALNHNTIEARIASKPHQIYRGLIAKLNPTRLLT